jgi:hypothetical protein
MKHTKQLLKFFVAVICMGILVSCHKTGGIGGGSGNPQTSASADSISNHLLFENAVKKQGTIPQGPSNSSLKISFEDTLFLVDQIKLPIKFLHTDISQNVAGIYMQVHAALIGGPADASYYYDVPEVKDLDSSDTVSVVMVGIDPTDLQLPITFNVTITPYNSSGLPIAEDIKPVKIVPHNTDPKNTCGLVFPNDDTWDWVMSYMEKSNFTSTPEKIWGGEGQDIGGSCCNGVSIYGACPGERVPNTHLHFNTFYQIASEQLTFYDNGEFDRRTVERGANPLPDSSNFCDPFEGRVDVFTNETLYHGHYTVAPGNIMTDIQQLHDSLVLQMNTEITDPKGGGYGNGGGVIHYIDCSSLVLIQQDLEGFGQHLYKIYHRRIFERWFEF